MGRLNRLVTSEILCFIKKCRYR